MKTLSSILLSLMLPLTLAAETVYLTSELGSDNIGAFDANILADDIHLEHSAIITNITMLMSIAGTQSCGLWIFESLNTPALYYWPFNNTPSSSSGDMKLYIFSIHAAVPKDFYVEFSAQGNGWDANNSDYVRCGSTVITGVASNSGIFYYGPVSEGQLTDAFEPGYSTFFTIHIKEAPVHISSLQAAGESIEISFTNLYPRATNHVDRNTGDEWETVASFVSESSGTNWTGAATNGHALYRLRREE